MHAGAKAHINQHWGSVPRDLVAGAAGGAPWAGRVTFGVQGREKVRKGGTRCRWEGGKSRKKLETAAGCATSTHAISLVRKPDATGDPLVLHCLYPG